jgi:hypothetical protein
MANEKHVVTNEARLSYVHLLKPYAREGQAEKYSVTVLVPKSDIVTKQRIDAAIEAAMQDGMARLWGGKRYNVHPVYDGDGVRQDGQPFGDECKGHWVFTAGTSVDRKPRVVDANVQDIIEPTKVYSGVYGRVGIDFYAYNNPNKKGVGCGLTNVQILRDGEPLGGQSVSAEEDFGAPQGYQMPQQPAPQYAPPQQAYGYVPQQAYGQPPQVNPITGLPM